MKEKSVLALAWLTALVVGWVCFIPIFSATIPPDKMTRFGWIGLGIVLGTFTFEKTVKSLKAVRKSLEDDSPKPKDKP